MKDFLAWYAAEARRHLAERSNQQYRSVLESTGLAPPSINLRLSAIRKLAAEVAENGLLDRSVTQGIVSLKGVHQSGDATVQHRGAVQDKPIQGQLRHAKAEITSNVRAAGGPEDV